MNNKESFPLESVLNSNEFMECIYELPIVLGKAVGTNEVVIKDLVELWHILIGGACGQGKTTVLYAMINSLLRKKLPKELQLVIIDPKGCEFDGYASTAKDFLAKILDVSSPILTDKTEATRALKHLCDVMDARYKLLETAGVWNIQEYNAKFKNGDFSEEQGHNFMPYMVIVVDEYGDLMITNRKEAEDPIVRLAQIGRRVGIHLIIATARIVSNVITGYISANFPTHIAFRVATSYESRMITYRPDAAELTDHGNFIFVSGKEKKRIQGAFVEDCFTQR